MNMTIPLVKLNDCNMKTILRSKNGKLIDTDSSCNDNNNNKQKIELVKIEDVSSIKKRREEKMTKQEKGFLKRLKNR